MAFTSTDLSKPAQPYVHKSFPKYVTHATEPARVVPDDAAWQALGPGWGRPEDPAPERPALTVTTPVVDEAVAEAVDAVRKGRKSKG